MGLRCLIVLLLHSFLCSFLFLSCVIHHLSVSFLSYIVIFLSRSMAVNAPGTCSARHRVVCPNDRPLNRTRSPERTCTLFRLLTVSLCDLSVSRILLETVLFRKFFLFTWGAYRFDFFITGASGGRYACKRRIPHTKTPLRCDYALPPLQAARGRPTPLRRTRPLASRWESFSRWEWEERFVFTDAVTASAAQHYRSFCRRKIYA